MTSRRTTCQLRSSAPGPRQWLHCRSRRSHSTLNVFVSRHAVPAEPNGNGHGNGNGRHGHTKSILGKVDEARRQAEIEAIVTALNASLWNRKQAANLLSIEYKALLYKMKNQRQQKAR